MDTRTFKLACKLPNDLADRWYKPITRAMIEFGIDALARQAMFLAQISHESAGLTNLTESFNYSPNGLLIFGSRLSRADRAKYGRRASERTVPIDRQRAIANQVYANRGGNRDAESGDGWRFRGRGLIQITFANNYRECGRAISVDLLNHPELLENDEYAARSAGWYWQVNKLNRAADAGDLIACTRAINGPAMAGMADRLDRWATARAVLGLPSRGNT